MTLDQNYGHEAKYTQWGEIEYVLKFPHWTLQAKWNLVTSKFNLNEYIEKMLTMASMLEEVQEKGKI